MKHCEHCISLKCCTAAEPCNMLTESEWGMLVDFERAKVYERQPLGAITGNRKRMQWSDEKRMDSNDDFSREV